MPETSPAGREADDPARRGAGEKFFPPPEAVPNQPQVMANYRIVRPLGSGGMGEVFLGEDTRLERSVALKIMAADLAAQPEQRKRFRQEAKAASGLVHPNICVIHEVGETEDGRPFLAMEYIEGRLLDDVMRDRRLPLREVVRIGIQVADALQTAHDKGIVHRDIKPANIMIDDRGRVKVLDFGLAKDLSEAAAVGTESSLLRTQAGVLLGTPHYMSPEQALGRPIDHRSDLFSLGVVLYELAAGQRPFLGKTLGETINNVVNQAAQPLGVDDPVLQPALDRLLLQCLEKEPNRRPHSARDVLGELQRLEAATARATQDTPAARPAPARNPTRLWQIQHRTGDGRPAVPIAFAIATLALAAAVYFYRNGREPNPGMAVSNLAVTSAINVPRRSIAVLPFDNFSAEKDTEFLSDGLTEEITTELSRIPGLKVAARNSAFAFKGRREDLRQVGATLGVHTLLEGSLRKSGNQLRVTAQLVNASDGYHLWSETYERSVDDLFAVQSEIARRIAERLELGTNVPSSAPGRGAGVRADIHTLYLQARHYWNRRGKDNLEHAAQLFRQAIDRDPTYAPAHAGLASTYVVLPGYVLRPEREYLPLARAAAARALELDPTSSEALAVEAHAATVDHKPAEAEALMKRSLALNPNNATAHHWYGVMLREYGRLPEAIAELQRAEELDPLSPIIKLNLALCYHRKGDKARARADLERYTQLFPDASMLWNALGSLDAAEGRFAEALLRIQKARTLEPDGPQYLEALGFAQARSGDTNAARQTLTELRGWLDKGFSVNGGIAKVYFGLKDYEQAIDWLERAHAAGENLSGLQEEDGLEEVRNHPRFIALCRKLANESQP